MDFGTKHQDMAAEIDDPTHVLRMDRGDLIAYEGKYHQSCHVGLNRWKKSNLKKPVVKIRKNEKIYLKLV